MNPLRNRAVAWGLLAAWSATIWYGSSLEMGALSPFTLFGVDKLGHASEYAILGFLAANALSRGLRKRRAGGGSIADLWQGGVLLAALWGWIDEVHQFWVPGRQTDPLDFVADVLGACLGAWLALGPIRRAAANISNGVMR